jgi:hypothetical protein
MTMRNQSGATVFIGIATYKYTYNNGILTLSSPTYDGNWSARAAQLIDLQNYFAVNATFNVDYVTSSDPDVTNLAGLYKVSDNTSFFYGSLRK